MCGCGKLLNWFGFQRCANYNSQANDDFCTTCGGIGRFLCCESCPKSFHFSCVNPPLDEESLPEGEWFCKECSAKRVSISPYLILLSLIGLASMVSLHISHFLSFCFANLTYSQSSPLPYKGIFRDLFVQIDRRNPTIFALPPKIRDRFEGVYHNDNGEYRDADMKVFKSTRSGFFEDQDVQKLTDKQGNLIFCYKCKGSALSGGPIARCDYCVLSWHLDCLNPPLPTVKTVGTKWKCPNHADHAFHKARRPKHAQIIDTNLRRGFKNDGNIDILDSSDEEQLEVNTRDLPFHNIRAPQYDDVPNAPVQIEARKHSEDSNESQAVKLDFIQSMQERRRESHTVTSNTQVLLALDEVASKPQDIREGVRNLCYMRAEGTHDAMTANCRNNIEILLTSALSLQSPLSKPKKVQDEPSSALSLLDPSEPLPPPDGTPKSGQSCSVTPPAPANSVSTNKHKESILRKSSLSNSSDIATHSRSRNSSPISVSDSEEIHPEERAHLIAIKKLLELKGKDTFMEFLLQKNIDS